MIRNLKALGLALVAVFAFGAMAASSASADTFAAEKTPAFLTATQGAAFDEFEVTDGLTFCEEVSYKGEQKASPTTAVVLTPTYNKCKSLGQAAVIDMKTCFYNFTINDTIANDTTGTVHVECTTKGDEITVTVASPTIKCTIHVEEQTIPVTYSAVAGGKIKATVSATTLKYSETKGTGMGACAASSPVTQSGGIYKGEGIVSGFSDAGHTKANPLSLVK